MSLDEPTVEEAALEWFGARSARRVKSEIRRVKLRRPFPFSYFIFLFSPFHPLATLRDTLLPKLLSGELSATAPLAVMEKIQ